MITIRAVAATRASDLHPEKNEDAFFVDLPRPAYRTGRQQTGDKLGAAGVFDGMGGHAAGEVASRLAAETIHGYLRTRHAEDVKEALRQAFLAGHEALVDYSERHRETSGLGTTSAVIVVRNELLTVGHLGDSRVYRLNGETLDRLTGDDGLLTENLRRGIITSAQAQRVDQCVDLDALNETEKLLFLQRNIVTKSLSRLWKEPTMKTVRLDAGDRIILTTDGIHDNLTDGEIALALRESDPASALVERAHEVSKKHAARSKPDDLTAIVMSIS